ncbi:uncharacterized protein LOC126909171 isoform X2 [Daktulosphaira vitifoliae]|uniref:uncharacterized protein LOC126909171 isoform X2 n=1 Tax=Daktulosphaira vitifoliae TaxID=58002 RepID=UPI0021A9E093|nr:uncharacterized protein LOC126909171 isoform X2 [Daktulosphaira vitifoliae]
MLKKSSRLLSPISNFFNCDVQPGKVVYPIKYLETLVYDSKFKEKVLHNKHYFNPMDWQLREEKCNKLKLKFVNPYNYQEIIKLGTFKRLTHPSLFYKDGLVILEERDIDKTYRLLSELLCGTDENSNAIRMLVQEEMSSNTKIKKFMNDKVSEYQQIRKKNGRTCGLGTQIELLAAAHALDICIYVYGNGYGDNYKFYWTLFHPNWPELENLDMSNETCLYVSKAYFRYYLSNIEDVFKKK